MRLRLLKVFAVLGFVFLFSKEIVAQNCIPTNINGAVINRDCSQICNALTFQIPHIKSSSDYTLVTTPYAPYPYNTPTGATDIALYNDDQYSNLINLPFTFCFYGQSYTSAAVGSNGIVTFDPANAGCSNAWPITQPIP